MSVIPVTNGNHTGERDCGGNSSGYSPEQEELLETTVRDIFLANSSALAVISDEKLGILFVAFS